MSYYELCAWLLPCMQPCLLACMHVLAVQAECEVLRAEALKWEDDAKTLRRTKDVSTLSLIHIHIQIYNQYSFICHFACIYIVSNSVNSVKHVEIALIMHLQKDSINCMYCAFLLLGTTLDA